MMEVDEMMKAIKKFDMVIVADFNGTDLVASTGTTQIGIACQYIEQHCHLKQRNNLKGHAPKTRAIQQAVVRSDEI